MKRFYVIIIGVIVMLNMVFIDSRAEEIDTPETEKTILDVLREAVAEQNLQENFFCSEMLPEELQGYSIEGKPVLMSFINCEFEYRPDDAIGTFAEMWENQEFHLLNFTVVESSVSETGTQTMSYIPTNSRHEYAGKIRLDPPFFPKYIETVLSEPAVQYFLGEQYSVNNVIMLGQNIELPKAVYFTDGGVFVRVFAGGEAAEFTWADFVEYYNAYIDYLISISYDENGEQLYLGTGEGFKKFIEEIYPTLGDTAIQGDSGMQNENSMLQHIWVYGIGILLLVCSIFTVMFNRKRRLVPSKAKTE